MNEIDTVKNELAEVNRKLDMLLAAQPIEEMWTHSQAAKCIGVSLSHLSRLKKSDPRFPKEQRGKYQERGVWRHTKPKYVPDEVRDYARNRAAKSSASAS